MRAKLIRNRLLIPGFVMAGMLVLTGCASSGDEAAPALEGTTIETPAQQEPVEETIDSTTDSFTTGEEEAKSTTLPAEESLAECSGLSADEALDSAIFSLPPVVEGMDFEWDPSQAETNNYDDCATLSWMLITARGGTVSTPWQIILFNNGEYIGTATYVSFGFYPVVSRVDETTIEVNYRYALEGESNAEASGSAISTFTIDEDTGEVTHRGELPPRY